MMDCCLVTDCNEQLTRREEIFKGQDFLYFSFSRFLLMTSVLDRLSSIEKIPVVIDIGQAYTKYEMMNGGGKSSRINV